MIRQQAPPKEKISKFALVIDWLRNRNTMEFLGVWESVTILILIMAIAIIKSQSGLNSFKISVKEFVARTGEISLRAKAGRYGGTYAHKDTASGE
ncbi:MAG: KilA-N domain-containing protein [Bacteroidaceae bacterium]|nr:KilA-N domain-containing protein [Bacteroidaceae bacterium]